MNDKTKKSIETQQNTVQFQTEAEVLLSQAINNNVPVETIEKLLAMRRELHAEQAKSDFDRAMSLFQAECPIIQKTKKVSFGGGGYSYAPLEDIVVQVRELLSKNGFSYTFDTKKTDSSLKTYCKVKHINGHSEVSEFEIQIDANSKMNVSQKDGAASSYGKRYAFCNAFGILTGDEDTDARNMEARNNNVQPVKETVEKEVIATVEQVSDIDVPTIEAGLGAMTCSECGAEINKKVYDFSMSRYGKSLCYNCQRA